MKKGKKISILGTGNVGATIAYSLAMDGMASELVLIDINKDKAKGEAMDIMQGTPLSLPVNIYAGEYEDTRDSDIVVVTSGMARKPGQTRIDLVQGNINIIKSIMPEVVKYAPDAVYVVVSNPVDILTYAVIQCTGLPASQVLGTGTLLDSSRLRALLAKHVTLNSKNVHAYVFGEHGDTAMIPWSLTSMAGMQMETYCHRICDKHNHCGKAELREIEEDVRTAGAQVIKLKGATYYAIGVATRRICEYILRDTKSVVTVSGLVQGSYGIDDVCLSLPFIIGARGIERVIEPPLLPEEEAQLRHSADSLKSVLASIEL